MKKFFYFAALCCFLFWWCGDDDDNSGSSENPTSQVANNTSNNGGPEPWQIYYLKDDYGQPTNNPVLISILYGIYTSSFQQTMSVRAESFLNNSPSFRFAFFDSQGYQLYQLIYTLKFRNSRGQEIWDDRGRRADGVHAYNPFVSNTLCLTRELNEWIYANLMNGETINAFMEDMDHRKYTWTIIPNNFRECAAQIRRN